MCVCRTKGVVSVVSESDVLIIFVILDGEGTARINSEWYKTV